MRAKRVRRVRAFVVVNPYHGLPWGMSTAYLPEIYLNKTDAVNSSIGIHCDKEALVVPCTINYTIPKKRKGKR